LKIFWKEIEKRRGAYIQDVAGVKDAWWHWTGSPTHNERFRVRERPISRWRLEPFGVAHGIGRREVKVVGDHHSASVSRNDVMWLWRRSSRVGKVVHPCRVKSFRKAVSTVMGDLETDARS
jgi:hypothetical protein